MFKSNLTRSICITLFVFCCSLNGFTQDSNTTSTTFIELVKEVEQLKDANTILNSRWKECRSNMNKLNQTYEVEKNGHTLFKDSTFKLNAHLKSSVESNTRLQTQVNSFQKELNTLNDELKKRNEKLNTLNDELEQISNQLRQAGHSNQKLDDLRKLTKQEYEQERARNAKYKSRIEALNQAAFIHQQEISRNQVELKVLKDSVDSTLKVLKTTKESLNNVHQDYITSENEKKELKKSINSWVKGILGFVFVIILASGYFLFIHRGKFSHFEREIVDSTNHSIAKALVKDLAFNRKAISITKVILLMELTFLVIITFLVVAFTSTKETISLLSLAKSDWATFFGSFGIPMIFTVTLYNVLESKRVSLLTLISDLIDNHPRE